MLHKVFSAMHKKILVSDCFCLFFFFCLALRDLGNGMNLSEILTFFYDSGGCFYETTLLRITQHSTNMDTKE